MSFQMGGLRVHLAPSCLFCITSAPVHGFRWSGKQFDGAAQDDEHAFTHHIYAGALSYEIVMPPLEQPSFSLGSVLIDSCYLAIHM